MKNMKGGNTLKKSKDKIVDTGKSSGFESISAIFFILYKFTELIYDGLKNGLFGKLMTSYSREQASFENSYLKNHFTNSIGIKHYFRLIRMYLSKRFENSLILNKISSISKNLVTMPLRIVGNFFFSFGIYIVVIYLLRLFLPVISTASADYVITGIIICGASIPMVISRDNIAGAVGKSVILGTLFFEMLGYREESFRQRTTVSKVKSTFAILLGLVFGLLTLFIHPLSIILILISAVIIALIFASPETGIILSLFGIPFLSFFDSPAIMLGMLVLVVFISYCVKLIRGKRIFKVEIIDLAVLLFGLLIYISGAITSGGIVGYREALISFELMLGYFLTVNLMRTAEWIKRCIKALITSGTIVAMIGIAQYLIGVLPTGAWLDTEYFYDISGRAVSLFDNPNILAVYLLLTLPFSLYSLLSCEKKKSKLLAGSSALLMIVCLVLTWSRGAWIAAILCVALFFLMYSRKTLVYILTSFIFLPFIPFFLPQAIVRRFMSIGDLTDSSTMYRIYTWRGTINCIKDFFVGGIGYGPTAFQTVYPQYAYAGIEAAEHSHNLFLQILIGVGIVGLVVFCLVIFLFAQMNLEYIKDSKDTNGKLIIVACICSVTALLIFGMFDFAWYSYRVFFLFWVIVGISCAYVRVGKAEQRRRGEGNGQIAALYD